MTEEIKSRIQYYIQKTRKLPPFQNLAKDFNISNEESQKLLQEYREEFIVQKAKVMAPNPAEPRKERVLKLTTEQFEEIKHREVPTDFHEVVVQQGGAMVALRIICGIVGIACIARGSSVIFELNSSNIFYALVSAIIFQGGSAILPIVSMLYFSIAEKRARFNAVIATFFMIGSIASMSYEVYASFSNFHQLNVKQEITLSQPGQVVDDPLLKSLQDKIDSDKTALASTMAQLTMRQSELSTLGVDASPADKALASSRVSANKAQAEKEQATLQSDQDKKTQRLDVLNKMSDSNSSAITLVSGDDQSSKNSIELWINLIPSIMMVIFTPVFCGLALFGIHVRRKE